MDLQWDDVPGTGAGVVWFDNVHVDSHTLAEPVGTEVTCLMLPDGTGACPFHLVPQDVVNRPSPHPAWPYAHRPSPRLASPPAPAESAGAGNTYTQPPRWTRT